MSSDSGLRAERMRVTVLSAPLDQTVPMSFGSLADRRVCLVQIDAGGLTGIGESWINYPAWAPRERLATLCDGIAPLLIGRDVADPRQVQRELTTRLLPVGRQWGAPGPIWQAISAVDLALWDLRGKLAGRPVAELLADGPVRENIPAYASGVGPTDVAQLCEAALEAGLGAVKTKIGFGEQRDRDTLRTARAALGAGPELFADANQAWDLEEAKAMSELLAVYDLGFLEEPLDSDELDEFEKLAAVTSIPLATGENLYGPGTFDRYVASSAIDLIQPDLAKSGGFTVGAQVADSARRTHTAVAPHCYGGAIGIAASLQCAAAFPAVTWLEFDVRANPLRTDLLAEPLRLESGGLVMPHGPGLGVDLDDTTVRRYQTHVEERTHHDL